MQLIDALELIITPDDPDYAKPIDFTWKMVGYTEDWIYIQLTYVNIWDISD